LRKETSKSGGKQEVEAQVEEVEASEKKRKGAVSKLVKEVFGSEEEDEDENEEGDDGNQDDLDGNDGEMEMSEGHGSEADDAEEEEEPRAQFSDNDGDSKESGSDYKKLYLNQKEYVRQLEATRGRNGGHDVEIMLQQKVEHLEGAKLSFYTVKVFREFLLGVFRRKHKVNLTDLMDGSAKVILEGKFLSENWTTIDTLDAWKQWTLPDLCEKLAKLYPESDALVPADASLEDRLGKVKAKIGKSTESMDKYIAKIVEAYEAGSKPSDESRAVEVLIKGLKSLAPGDRATTINVPLASDLEQHPKPTTVLTFTHKAQLLHSKLRTAVALVTKYKVRVDPPIGKGNRALDDDSDVEEAPGKKGAGNLRFNAP